jgi:hypothetical protein
MSEPISNMTLVKPKTSDLATIITLLAVISFLIYLSWTGVSKTDSCIKSEKSLPLNQDHVNSLNRNKKISGFSVGLNIGMLTIALIPAALLSTQALVLLAVVIIALSSTAITSYEKLNDECKTSVENFNNQVYGYMGVGVGIFLWIGLKNALVSLNKVTLSTRILLGFALLNSLVLTWANWNTADNCDGLSVDAREEMESFKRTNQIMFGICLVLLLMLAVSFRYFPN